MKKRKKDTYVSSKLSTITNLPWKRLFALSLPQGKQRHWGLICLIFSATRVYLESLINIDYELIFLNLFDSAESGRVGLSRWTTELGELNWSDWERNTQSDSPELPDSTTFPVESSFWFFNCMGHGEILWPKFHWIPWWNHAHVGPSLLNLIHGWLAVYIHYIQTVW